MKSKYVALTSKYIALVPASQFTGETNANPNPTPNPKDTQLTPRECLQDMCLRETLRLSDLLTLSRKEAGTRTMYLLVRATYMFVRAMYLLFICNLPPFIYGIRILSVHMPSQLFFLKPVQSCVTRCSNKCCLKIVCTRHKLRGVFKDDKQLSNVWYSFSNKFKIVHVSYLYVVRRPCNLHSATRVSVTVSKG